MGTLLSFAISGIFINPDHLQHINTTTSLIHYLTHELIDASKNESFDQLIHPIILQEPELFSHICSTLQTNPNLFHDFMTHLFQTASYPIFQSAFEFNNTYPSNITIFDLWKLLQMTKHSLLLNNNWITNAYFVDNKLYINSDLCTWNALICSYNTSDSQHSVTLQSADFNINFAQVPSFLSEIYIDTRSYSDNSTAFQYIDLSNFDPSCNIKVLTIIVFNGVLIFGDHTLPASLKDLRIESDIGYIHSYVKLWQVGGNIETLTIISRRRIEYSDLFGIENMMNLKYLYADVSHTAVNELRYKLTHTDLILINKTKNNSVNKNFEKLFESTSNQFVGNDAFRDVLWWGSAALVVGIFVVGVITLMLLLTYGVL
eukprot:453445_1